MRTADTYRAARREAAKQTAKDSKVHLSTVWHIARPARRAQPKLSTSKYMPHQGKQERERRARRFA